MLTSARIEGVSPQRRFVAYGRIESVRGQSVISRGPEAAIGELLELRVSDESRILVEVAGFLPQGRLILTPYGEMHGVRQGMMVVSSGRRLVVPVGTALLGRVIDGTGQPIDGRPVVSYALKEIGAAPISPLDRHPITDPLWTGIRAIDSLLTLGQGQRVGIFAGAGLGKTTLVRSLLAGADADVAVVALVGERGREIAEFHQELSPEARQRTVMVAATSDSPAIMRLRAIDTAFLIAEDFRSRGLHVMMVVDSLTRVAMAQSEVGLESGEIAAVRGYTPSVFHLLPRLLERAGRVGDGSITGIFTVLLDSDDPTDPIGDAVRGILDGNLYLSRTLAEAHHFPAIDVLRSLSRVMPQIVSDEQYRTSGRVRRTQARIAKSADLVALGAYQEGADPLLDAALRIAPALEGWLRQDEGDETAPDEGLQRVQSILESEEVLATI